MNIIQILILLLVSIANSALSSDIAEVQAIFNDKCISCHKAGGKRIDLSSVKASSLEAQEMITPGDSNNSALVTKLKNAGGNMPPRTDLTSDEYHSIKNWIDSLSKSLRSNDHKEVQIYYKCFRQFTQTRMPLTDSRYLRVKHSEMSGSEACLDLLSEANGIENSGVKSILGKKIVDSFQKFHLSWFPGDRSFGNIAGFMDSLFDTSMPGLYFTKNLFDNQNFKNIFTSNMNLKAIRDGGLYDYKTKPKPGGRVFFKGIENQADSIVQTGEISKIIEKPETIFSGITKTGDTWLNGISVDPHLGGGVLGNSSYILLNAGASIFRINNGGEKLLRSFTKNIFNHFLCRDIPVIRPGDEAKFVSKDASSKLPFRNGNSCMKCHASIDPMARVYRNIRRRVYGRLTNLTQSTMTNRLRVSYLKAFDVIKPSEDLENWPDEVEDFHRRPPKGALYFRDYSGKLQDIKLEGVSELGQIFSELDDVYACTASRYFEHLTGIKVSLNDLGNIQSPRLSKKEKRYRNMVIEWGKDLKKHQSLKKMIGSMISTDAYLKPGLAEE